VTNGGTIRGTTGTGINLAAGGTVVDAGTISGGNGTAISFGGTAGNLLVLDPGYKLSGVVVGGTSAGASNTLELASAASAGTVTAALNTEFVNFGTVNVDVGANWTLTGTSSLAGVTLTDLGTLTNTGSLGGGAGAIIVISSGGSEIVLGADKGTQIRGGSETVSSGGSATSTTVSSGGSLTVSSGGTASGTTISGGGFEYVLTSGSASAAVVSSGGQQSSAGRRAGR